MLCVILPEASRPWLRLEYPGGRVCGRRRPRVPVVLFLCVRALARRLGTTPHICGGPSQSPNIVCMC